jgi:hypothetical protein
MGDARKRFGVVFLYKLNYCGAAGTDDHILLPLVHQRVVLLFDDGSANRRFLNFGETQLFKHVSYGLNADSAEVRRKRRRKAHPYGTIALEQRFRFLKIVPHFLGVLGAGNKTAPAQYALILHDLRLAVFKLDRLNRTVADALVTGFTVSRF